MVNNPKNFFSFDFLGEKDHVKTGHGIQKYKLETENYTGNQPV
jgi:hypothetical protein